MPSSLSEKKLLFVRVSKTSSANDVEPYSQQYLKLFLFKRVIKKNDLNISASPSQNLSIDVFINELDSQLLKH